MQGQVVRCWVKVGREVLLKGWLRGAIIYQGKEEGRGRAGRFLGNFENLRMGGHSLIWQGVKSRKDQGDHKKKGWGA